MILCPDFIQIAGCAHILRLTPAQEEDDYEGKLQFAQIGDEKVGSIGVFYKRVQARVGGSTVFDSFGRKIARTTGLVIRGVVNRQQFRSAEAEQLLASIENEAQRAFEDFWNAADWTQAKISSCRNFGGTVIPNLPPEKPIAPSPYRARPSPAALPPRGQKTGGPRDGGRGLEPALKVAYVLLAASFALSAACSYEYFALKAQLNRVAKQFETTATQARFETIDTRLSTLEKRVTSIETHQ